MRKDKTEQNIHDLVVRESAKTYTSNGGTAYTNPSSEKNLDINGLYPDVIATQRNGVKAIEEIETASTVTEDECERQWKSYSKLNYIFRLVVPLDKVPDAQRIARNAQISPVIQGYEIIDDGKVKFYT